MRYLYDISNNSAMPIRLLPLKFRVVWRGRPALTGVRQRPASGTPYRWLLGRPKVRSPGDRSALLGLSPISDGRHRSRSPPRGRLDRRGLTPEACGTLAAATSHGALYPPSTYEESLMRDPPACLTYSVPVNGFSAIVLGSQSGQAPVRGPVGTPRASRTLH